MKNIERRTHELDRVNMLIPTFLSDSGPSGASTDEDLRMLIIRFVHECRKVGAIVKETLLDVTAAMYAKQASLLVASAMTADNDVEVGWSSGAEERGCQCS